MWTPAVKVSVNCSNINPRVETIWFPDLFPLALVLQTQTEVPVRPGDTRGSVDDTCLITRAPVTCTGYG